nr:cyclic nucleotide-binding domain-containing protein [Candidatus Gracilibacteria bacterium]
MLNIEFYKSSGFFGYKELQKGDIVFNEGDIDKNLYIIISGKLVIEKYTSIEKKEKKELALLSAENFFGEASLDIYDINKPKENSVVAKENSLLLFINGDKGIENFINKHPIEGLNLLRHIISITNKRLLSSNKLITVNHEVVKSIMQIENINEKNIFMVIDKIKLITGYDYILFLEANPVVNNYYTLKYDTREKGKLKDDIIEKDLILSLKGFDNWVLSNNNYIQKLNIGSLDLGFMIFGKNSLFTYDDKRLIISIGNSLTGLLKQKEILKDDLNRSYMKNV